MLDMNLNTIMRVLRVVEKPVTKRSPSETLLMKDVDTWVDETDMVTWVTKFYNSYMKEAHDTLYDVNNTLETLLTVQKHQKPPSDMSDVEGVTKYLFWVSATLTSLRGATEGVPVLLDQIQRRETWVTKAVGSVLSSEANKAEAIIRLAINDNPTHILIEELAVKNSAVADRIRSLSEAYEVISRRITLELETREDPTRGRK
jgi:hypothetical protein